MPTEANLLDAYDSFAELQTACARFIEAVNARAHRVTRRPPGEMLAEQAPWVTEFGKDGPGQGRACPCGLAVA